MTSEVIDTMTKIDSSSNENTSDIANIGDMNAEPGENVAK